MMFHLALPELKTLGVMTLTPDFTRSAHVLMCFGFPLRTTKDTMELVTMPLVVLWSQLFDTRPALTNFAMSGSSEKLTRSAGKPSTTEVAWVPEGPKEGDTVTPLPPWSWRSPGQHRVRGLGRGVRHEAHRTARGARGQSRDGSEGERGEGEGADSGGPPEGSSPGRGATGRDVIRSGLCVHGRAL